jgi:hypothetical protein
MRSFPNSHGYVARLLEGNGMRDGTARVTVFWYDPFGHLANIIENNWEDFQPHVHRVDWARSIFVTVERSRNVIVHSGALEIEDIERVGMNIRDWVSALFEN